MNKKSTNKNWYEITNKDNHSEIFIYDEIGYWGTTAKQFIKDLKAVKDSKTITLRINSPGGSITDGNAIYNAIKALKADVTVQIDSLAASMATVIALAGSNVKMAENGFFMIHNPQGGAYGESKDLKTMADLMDKMKTNIINVYANKSGKETDEISGMMDDVTWMTAQEALEDGFIDEITDVVVIENSFNMENLEKIPVQFAQSQVSQSTDISNSQKEDIPMIIKVKKEVQPQETPKVVIDQTAIEEKFKADEMKRKNDIKSVFAPFQGKHTDLMNKCLDNLDCSEQDSRDLLLKDLGKGEAPIAGASDTVVIEDQSDKYIKGVTAALSARAGLESDDSANELRGYTQMEMARLFLERGGIKTSGMDKMAMVGRALMPINSMHSTSDFANALKNTASKSMLRGYDEAEETFQDWTQEGNLSDFKVTDRIDLNTFSALEKVAEGGEYHSGTIGDHGEQVQLATYGKLFSITRQAIINDDLRVFTQVPRRMGRAAIRTVGNLVYAVLTGNPNMGDGVALFHASHANLAGTVALPTTASFDAARVAMGIQKDPDGNATLNVRPAFVLVPLALQGTASVVVDSETEIKSNQNNSKVPNSVRGMVTVISDARLDANSSTAWYMAANGSMHDTIEVSYLDGNSMPTLEQQNGWSIDGVDFKVRLDAAVSPLEYRTMYKNAGA